jgi:membrane fusion protein, multidrug efflux system
MRKTLIYWGLLLAVLVAGAYFGLRGRPDQTEARPVARPAGGDQALPVYVHRVEPRDLADTVLATGTIHAEEGVDLVSELAGVVVELTIEEGTVVRRGDVLLRLDERELRAQHEQTRQRVALARVQAERQRQLYEARSTSRENLDTALHELRIMEAELDLIATRLDKSTLRAPFDGVIGLRHVSPGAYVTPATRIATLQKIDRLRVDLALPERFMQRVEPGTAIEVRVAGRPTSFAGIIHAVEPRIDPATRTLRVRARADNPDGRVLPGAFATVEVPLTTLTDTLLVPAPALIPDINGQFVWVVQEDQTVRARRVSTGLRLSREVQILEGLAPGDLVVTTGQLQLRPGSRVRPLTDNSNTSPVAP